MRRITPARRASVPVALIGAAVAGALAGTGVADAASSQFSGAFGSVAAVAGSSMEVQNPSTGQTTVSWSPSTVFTQTVTQTAAAVGVGDCVSVTGRTSKGTVTASSVSITKPTSGKCVVGASGVDGRGGVRVGGNGSFPGGSFPRPGGNGKGGGPGSGPQFAPGGERRPGFPGSANFGFAGGQVKSVTSTSMVISGFSSAGFGRITKSGTSTKSTKSSGTSKSARPPTPKATTVHVKLTASTAYTEVQAAASTAVAVGDCVTATGTSSSTGAVEATSVHITSTGGKSCNPGFGGGRFFASGATSA
jgi:hypothetical protein